MAAGDSYQDPQVSVSEGIRQIRDALTRLREDAVAAVKNRYVLEDELARWDRDLLDLETKASLADKLNDPKLAGEIRDTAKQRRVERDRVQLALTNAQAAAEAAKTTLPEEEARLMQQANDLKAQLTRLAAARVENNQDGSGTNADEMWDRATSKIRDLGREAAAREEIAGLRGGAPNPPIPGGEQRSLAYLTPRSWGVEGSRSAEQMLEDLESRLGLAAKPDGTAGTPEAQAEAPAATKNVNVIVAREVTKMDPNQRVKVAAIGTGGIFRGAHLPAHVDLPQVQLVAFVDPDKNAQELVRKRFQGLVEEKSASARDRGDLDTVKRLESDFESIRIFEDISQVIEMTDDRPDLLDVCTQPLLHAPLSIQGLEAGFHVMCEKPISRSWLESQRLIETIKRTGRFYQHNENWLFDPDYYTVKKLVDAGSIGELIAMFLNQSHGGPEGNPKFWNSDYGGGGALLDNGIHAIGAAWFITGMEKTPTYVKAAQPFGMSIRMPHRIIEGRYQEVRVDDDAHILIRFEDSKTNEWSTAHIEGSWSEKDSADTCYIGSTGRIDMVNEDGKRFAVVTDSYGNVARKLRVSGSNWQHWPSSFYGEIQNMAECIKVNEQSIMTAQFGADCSAIVGASYLSEKRGKAPVHLNEFKEFANEIASRYPDDPAGADNALVDALLSAVRDKQ